MGTKHQATTDLIGESKKKRRVGFSKTDAGLDVNECIKIYLVSSKEEVDSTNSFCLKPVDLSPFFEEDEKIYGYQGLKITIWLSTISFHAYADISFINKSDGGKGITDLKASLQNIFAENLMEKKEDFLKTFSSESNYINSIIPNAEILQHKPSNNESAELEVLRVIGSSVGPIYSRLVSLALLLIDGSNPIDITDPRWEMYLLIQKKENSINLLGFSTVYRFHKYPESERLRLGQILILPPYQRKGYGKYFLEVLNKVAINENVYDFTIEEPVESLLRVRTCIDIQSLLAFEPIKNEVKEVISRFKQESVSKKSQLRAPLACIEDVRKVLKINKRQFSQCWEILVYMGLGNGEEKYVEVFKGIIYERVKEDILGKFSEGVGKHIVDVPTEYDDEMSFVMFKTINGEPSSVMVDDDQAKQEEQISQLVDQRMDEIKSIAHKVLSVNDQ